MIVDAHGIVLADSALPAELGASYASRPEIAAALAGRAVQVQRYSNTLRTELLATAVPIVHDGRVIGAVRVTQSVASVQSAIRDAELGLVLIAVIVLMLGLTAGAVIAGQIAGPVQRLQRVASRVAQGDLSARAVLEGSREQRSLANSFNEMTHRISRLLAAQREFVADASHQLRTPLTALRLRLEEARAEVSSAAADADLEAAIGEVDRLSHTVEELLVLSRAGERRTEGAPVDLRELAESVTDRWSRRADGLGISLEHRQRAGRGPIWASREDLEHALDVLVENALNYSPPSSTVTILSGPSVIEVADEGPGIDTDEAEVLFERFHRGAAGRSGPPGSGLGLAIARELARAWGGEVRLVARPAGAGRTARGAVATLSFEAELGRSGEPGGPPEEDGKALPALNPDVDTVRSQ